MRASKNNSVFIGSKSQPGLNSFIKKNKYTSAFVICDTNTLNYCLSGLILNCPQLKNAEIIELEPGEESKDLAVLSSIWQTLVDFGADKKSLVVNLGGGVVSDIGGFAASTFKRGMDFINIPTTLLSMADASVGGKTGINFSGVKNLIGTITQPKAVFIDPLYLKTLPERQMVNGFAEIIKAALIQNKKFFESISELKIDDSFNNIQIISKSIDLKNGIVLKDPSEKGLRKILNFGHTIGHAVESTFLEKSQPLLHGEAIAIGMMIESLISYFLKRIAKNELNKIQSCLAINFKFYPLLKEDMETFFTYFEEDKKHRDKAYMFALIKGIGKCDHGVTVKRALVERSIQHYNTHIADAY